MQDPRARLFTESWNHLESVRLSQRCSMRSPNSILPDAYKIRALRSAINFYASAEEITARAFIDMCASRFNTERN